MATAVLASIGDQGVLNATLSEEQSAVWLDRDLSWLDFNERVLAEALDERTPLLERAKFLAIFTSNLDEFVMKRVAILCQAQGAAQKARFQELREKLLPMLAQQAQCYRETIIPGLAASGVFLRRWDDLTPEQQEEASEYFEDNISAAMTPLVVDPEHPFPFLSNLSTSLIFKLHDPERGDSMYARLKVPTVLKQWVGLNAGLESGQKLLVPLYEVIRGNVDKLYGGMKIKGCRSSGSPATPT